MRFGALGGVLLVACAGARVDGPAPAPAPSVEAQRQAREAVGLVPETFALPDGAVLPVERRGARAALVLVGAAWLVPDVLDALDQDAALAAVPVAALDGRARLGFPARPGATHLAQDADDLAAWLEAERAVGTAPVVLLAQGYHAVVAALAAARAPGTVAALALVAPLPATRTPWLDDLARAASARTDPARLVRAAERARASADERLAADVEALLLASRFADPALARSVRADPFLALDGGDGALSVQAERAIAELGDYDLTRELARVDVPAFVLHGAGDALPADASRAFAAALPRGRFDFVERSGAFPWIEAPAAFRAWLAGVLDARR